MADLDLSRFDFYEKSFPKVVDSRINAMAAGKWELNVTQLRTNLLDDLVVAS